LIAEQGGKREFGRNSKKLTLHHMKRIIIQGTLITSLWGCVAFGQNQLKLTGVNATVEGAIQLHWASNPNEVYEIDYADSLLDTNFGYTVWNKLLDNYPSHGTNSFWLDTGSYLIDTPIPHPKYVGNRFYRVVKTGVNSGTTPTVSITSPANGSTLSGTITVSVSASSSYPLVNTKLYVDGEEVFHDDILTNYTFNTCEWPNGAHTLFATAEAHSNYDGPNGVWPIYVGRAVSAYRSVTFSNLITRIAFSQPFFEPSLGQTQQVTATFAANVNWTLKILNDSSNAVRTVTGSGGSMVYNWNGTGDGGVTIPDGLYNYSISVLTNGLPLPQIQPSTNNPPPPPPPGQSMVSSSTAETVNVDPHPRSAKEAFALGLDYFYPDWPPMPPVRVNGQWVPWEDVYGPAEPAKIELSDAALGTLLDNNLTQQGSGSGVQLNGFRPLYSGPSSQAAVAPTRPPTSAIKGKGGDYSIFYYSYPTTNTWPVPTYGSFPLIVKVKLEGSNNPMTLDPIPGALNQSGGFIQTMKKLGWKLVLDRHDTDLRVKNLRRADLSIFGDEWATQAELGLFISHGTFGTDMDLAPGASGAKLTYWPSGNPADSQDPWLRMCQFGFGGNLKWMGLLACNSLTNFSSMVNAGAIPLKTTHMVCGAASIVGVGENIGSYWGQNMIKSKQAIADAWFAAGRKEYNGTTNLTTPAVFRVAGYPECMADTLANATNPTNPSAAPGNLVNRDSTVWP
jgi:hypothetical protein